MDGSTGGDSSQFPVGILFPPDEKKNRHKIKEYTPLLQNKSDTKRFRSVNPQLRNKNQTSKKEELKGGRRENGYKSNSILAKSSNK